MHSGYAGSMGYTPNAHQAASSADRRAASNHRSQPHSHAPSRATVAGEERGAVRPIPRLSPVVGGSSRSGFQPTAVRTGSSPRGQGVTGTNSDASSSMGAAQLRGMLQRADKVANKAKQRSAVVRGEERLRAEHSPLRAGGGRQHSHSHSHGSPSTAAGTDGSPAKPRTVAPVVLQKQKNMGGGFRSYGNMGGSVLQLPLPHTGNGGTGGAGLHVDSVAMGHDEAKAASTSLPSGAGPSSGSHNAVSVRNAVHSGADAAHAHNHGHMHDHAHAHPTAQALAPAGGSTMSVLSVAPPPPPGTGIMGGVASAGGEAGAGAGAGAGAAAIMSQSSAQHLVSTTTTMKRQGSGKTIIRRKKQRKPQSGAPLAAQRSFRADG